MPVRYAVLPRRAALAVYVVVIVQRIVAGAVVCL